MSKLAIHQHMDLLEAENKGMLLKTKNAFVFSFEMKGKKYQTQPLDLEDMTELLKEITGQNGPFTPGEYAVLPKKVTKDVVDAWFF